MNLVDKINSAILLFRTSVLNQRIPLAVRIEVTNRCPNRCLYCNIWEMNSVEPKKEEIFELLKELKKLGTKKVSFSGGEPMLRKDIGEIINYCKTIGISPEMNTCGFLVAKRIKEIKVLDLIKISLDGPKDVNDFITRRNGSYEDAISAIEAAKSYDIKTVITVTMTKYNINHFGFIIELAKKYNCFVAFQPVKNMVYSKTELKELFPDIHEYKKAVAKLISLKIEGDGVMRNSLAGLVHIYHWPDYKKIRCAAGRLFMIFDVDGTVYPCDRVDNLYSGALPNWQKLGVKKSIKSLPEVNCSGCGFCGALELSFMLNFKLSVLKEVIKLLKK